MFQDSLLIPYAYKSQTVLWALAKSFTKKIKQSSPAKGGLLHSEKVVKEASEHQIECLFAY